MAMKKVEEKNKKEIVSKKKEKVVEAIVEEEKVVCEECGKKYLASLKECPKCGFSPLVAEKKRKTFYDDEEEFEDFDDEDIVGEKKKKVEVKEEKKEVKKIDKNKKEEASKPEKNVNKKVSLKSKKANSSSESNEIFSFIKILVVIVLLVGVVWLVVSLLNNEFDKDEKEEEEEVVATIQNDKILASSIFTKEDEVYYVFAYDASEDNNWAVYYTTLFSEYDVIEDKGKLPMFWVDLSDPLNKDVVAEKVEDENTKPGKYEDLSIYSPALIRIKNGKLDKYYDGDYAIDKLTRLIASFREEEK